MKIKGENGKIFDVPKGAFKSIYEPMGYIAVEASKVTEASDNIPHTSPETKPDEKTTTKKSTKTAK